MSKEMRTKVTYYGDKASIVVRMSEWEVHKEAIKHQANGGTTYIYSKFAKKYIEHKGDTFLIDSDIRIEKPTEGK